MSLLPVEGLAPLATDRRPFQGSEDLLPTDFSGLSMSEKRPSLALLNSRKAVPAKVVGRSRASVLLGDDVIDGVCGPG
jgi:hypothetical protein